MIAFVSSKNAAIFSTYVSRMIVTIDVTLSTPDDITHCCDKSPSCRSVRRIFPTSSALIETFGKFPSSLTFMLNISCERSGSRACIVRARGRSCPWRMPWKWCQGCLSFQTSDIREVFLCGMKYNLGSSVVRIHESILVVNNHQLF